MILLSTSSKSIITDNITDNLLLNDMDESKY